MENFKINPAPYEQDLQMGGKMYDDDIIDRSEDNLLLIHLNNDELAGLLALQGQEIRDEETGYYSFPLLEEKANDPEFVEKFISLFEELRDVSDPEVLYEEAVNELPKPDFSEKEMLTESKTHLSEMGENGDDRMCFIPENFTSLLIKLNNGDPQINKQTGLISFKFDLGSMLSLALPIMGSVFGGPSGGMMGALAGAAFGGGKRMNPMLMYGLGSMLSNMGGAPGGVPGGTPGGGMGNFFSSLGNMFGMGQNQQNSIPASMAGQIYPGAQNLSSMAQGASPQAPGQQQGLQGLAAKPPAPGGQTMQPFPSGAPQHGYMMDNFMKMANLVAAQNEQNKLTKYNQNLFAAQKKNYEDNRRLYSGYKGDMNETLDHIRKRVEAEQAKKKKVDKYAHGGSVSAPLLKGKGKGQDDTIKTSVPSGTYIVDATTVGHLGDGYSEAGAAEINHFVKELMKRVPKETIKKYKNDLKHESSPVDVALSAGEVPISPLIVKALGNGNKDFGAQLLDQAREKIRAEKALAGGGMPEKAKPLSHYF